MKKLLAIILALILLSACGSTTEPSSTASNPDTTAEQSAPESAESEKKEDFQVTYTSAKLFKNSIGTVWLQTIIEVENTGTGDLYMNSGAYDLEDSTGKLIASRDMVSVYPQVISPGEKAYYYEETTLEEVDESTELKVLPRPKAESLKVDKLIFPVTDFELESDDYFSLKMIGRVENTSSEPQNMVYVACVLYNAEEKPIGVIFTILMEELAAGDKIGFEGTAISLPPDITLESVASHSVIAYGHQYQF